MKSNPYDIVLLPAISLAKKAIGLSKKLEPLDVYFTLDNKTFFPHVSLYMLQLDDMGLKKAIDLLSTIASETSTIEAWVNDYHYEDNYVDAEYVKSKELINLQRKVIDKLNPIRDGLREKDKARLNDAIGETRSNLINYGYRFVGKMFAPHLTFTRFKNNQENILQLLPPKESFNGKYSTLGIFEMGDNGTCVSEIKSWKLQIP